MDKYSKYLYRALRKEEVEANNILIPKSQKPFQDCPQCGTMVSGDSLGETEKSAVLHHQNPADKSPTSGVSTTPHLDRARHYNQCGVIVKINRQALSKYSIVEDVVKEHLHPSRIDVPEDDEIILVKAGSNSFPKEIIEEVIDTRSTANE